jgi:2-amino-4-hydroxy-6-hydroxymethyldihydropteridine diphosphokinase
VRKLAELPRTSIHVCSSVYKTEPVGKKDQPDFLNAVVELSTELEALDLHTACKRIEGRIGRTRSERWGPREIDLDLLYVGAERISKDTLVLPHPEITRRKFVLVPLAEVAPDFIDPVYRVSVSDLLARCPDASSVTKTPYTIGHNVVEA